MKIRIWGCRGSIPSPGYDTSRYGGNTTCIEIRLNDGTLIIIDAGTGIRRLGRALLKEKNLQDIYLFLTHAHWDHLQGFPFFIPAYLPQYTIRVRGGPQIGRSLLDYLVHQMDPPYFPIQFSMLQAGFEFEQNNSGEQTLGGATISPIPLDHPNGGSGYKITENGSTFVFLTDNELGFGHENALSVADYVDIAGGADLLIHDAQYTDEEYQTTRGWGHSTFRKTAEFAKAARVKRLGLFHHDPEHLDTDMDGYVRFCRDLLQSDHVDCFGVQEGTELDL